MTHRISIFFFSMLLLACSEHDKFQRISTTGKDAESVYLTHDNDHRPVIVWTEKQANETTFFYAVSDDGGKSFPNKIAVAVDGEISTHAEGMPKVAFKKNGVVIAAYEKRAPTKENKYAGAVYYVQSADGGQTWSAPHFIHSDTVAGRSRSFFDIETLPDGEVGAAWLDIKLKNEKGGRSVRFAKTQDDKGFTNEILIDSTACECCRIDLHAAQGNVAIAYRGLTRGNVGQSIRDIKFVTSRNDGLTFTIAQYVSADDWNLDGCPHTGPSLCTNNDGLHASWYTEGNGNGIYYAYQQTYAKTFSAREQITQNGHHPQLKTLGDNVLMVWEENAGDTDKSSIQYQLRNGNTLTTNTITPPAVNAYLPVICTGADGFIVGFLMDEGEDLAVYVTRL